MDSVEKEKPLLGRADQLNLAGAELYGKGEHEGARLHFLAALLIDPDHPMAWQNLGAASHCLEHHEVSLLASRRALAAFPATANELARIGPLSNQAVALTGLRRYAEARELLEHVLEMLPDTVAGKARAPLLHNYGLVRHLQGDFQAAKDHFQASLELAENIQVRNDFALALLACGYIGEGLREYECRWAKIGSAPVLYKSPMWNIGAPQWFDEELPPETRLLVHSEQGFGDTLMFCRFIQDLLRRQITVTIAVPAELLSLMQSSFSGCRIVDWQDKDLPNNFDYHVPMLSLMQRIGIRRPQDIRSYGAYLKAPAGAPQIGLHKAKLKVGICWASGDHGQMLRRRRRVVPLVEFLQICEIPGVKLFSLQKGPGEKDIVELGAEGIIFDPMNKVDDFGDTAGLIQGLDFVISVDSAVAHLAAALGKPVLLLSPFTRCWRWWGQTNGWPWYEDMQLLYQSQDGGWGAAMAETVRVVRKLLI